jgi:DUF4097 and DUF4098 domain-containing protein YvlB
MRNMKTRRIGPIALVSLLVWLPLGSRAAEFRETVSVSRAGTLEVDLPTGAIEIETDDEPEVRVEAHVSGWRADPTLFKLTSDGTDARLVLEGGRWFHPRVRVRIAVPEKYSVDVETGSGPIEIEDLGGNIQAQTSGGDIEVDGAVGTVELETAGGNIEVEEVRGDVRASTSGGHIDISEVSGRVEVETSGGSIRVHDVGGPVDAHTSGGHISVRFSDRAEGDIQTSGGSIEVEFVEEAGVDLDARTSGGRVTLDEDFSFTGEARSDQIVGRINGGGPQLSIDTSGGNVRVLAR